MDEEVINPLGTSQVEDKRAKMSCGMKCLVFSIGIDVLIGGLHYSNVVWIIWFKLVACTVQDERVLFILQSCLFNRVEMRESLKIGLNVH